MLTHYDTQRWQVCTAIDVYIYLCVLPSSTGYGNDKHFKRNSQHFVNLHKTTFLVFLFMICSKCILFNVWEENKIGTTKIVKPQALVLENVILVAVNSVEKVLP